MDFRCQMITVNGTGGSIAAVAADALLMLVAGERAPDHLPPPIAAALADAVAQGDFEFKPARLAYWRQLDGVQAPRLLVACAGDGSAKALCKAVAAALAQVKTWGVAHLAVAMAGVDAIGSAHAEALAAAVGEACYQYRHTKPSAPAPAKLKRVTLLVTDRAAQANARRGLAQGAAIAEGVALARELANRPANHCTPSALADEARKLAKQHGLKCQVLERKQIEALAMGGLLGVAQGSDEPPRFIVIQYRGGPKSQPPLVLVGKGVTFDSGGISIKPSAEMDEMKFDMCGAASVLGTLRALAELKPALNVVGLIPACENLPSGRALKPGDVVTSLSGQTIEVLNTDAEGRLILCDALSYAQRLKPQAVVDIATLTGACMIALGAVRSGLFCADDALAADLLAAGDAALDPCWRMPLDDEYEEALKSNFADTANVGSRAGGAIVAARFLHRFAGSMRWAHLDIAGTAWKSGSAKGATGRPVGLLTHWLLRQAG